MVKESLSKIYQRHATQGDVGCGDKGSIHSYIPEYERLLAPYRKKSSVMEIGLALGQSLAMWGEYFGPESRIVGVDISVVFDAAPFDSRFTIIEADATQSSINEKIGSVLFDVIIDDGSHMERDQVATFNLLKGRMNHGGLYVIEDILNLNLSRERLTVLHDNCEVIDLRGIKGRFDDVLLVYRF